jgi:DNA-binding beta-propeller fold protein YncE
MSPLPRRELHTCPTATSLDVDTNTVTLDRRIGNGSRRVAVAPDGRRVYVTNGEAVFVIDTLECDRHRRIYRRLAVAASPDSRLCTSPVPIP